MIAIASRYLKQTVLKTLRRLVGRLLYPRAYGNTDIESQTILDSGTTLNPLSARHEQLQNKYDQEETFKTLNSSQQLQHREGNEKRFTLDVTEAMIESMQSIIECDAELLQHQQEYDAIERGISNAEVLIAQTHETIHGDVHKVQQDIDRLGCHLNQLSQQRDALSPRLSIFRSNIHVAHDDFQGLFRDTFSRAGLLDGPTPEAEESAPATEPDLEGPTEEDLTLSQNKGFHPEVHDRLTGAWQELVEAQDLFDNMSAEYAVDQVTYEECIANGEDDTPRSQFDRMFVHYKMQVTRNLIDAERKFEDQKAEAIALGAVASSWGALSDDGGSIAYTSLDHDVERAAQRDYTFVHSWLRNVFFGGEKTMNIEDVDVEMIDAE